MTEETHPVDRHVGARLRVARLQKKMSQECLARAAGVTFQQMQKYEKGDNRVSASRLWMIAQTLALPVSFFFEGLPEDLTGEQPHDREVREFQASPLGYQLAVAAMEHKPHSVQAHIELLKAHA